MLIYISFILLSLVFFSLSQSRINETKDDTGSIHKEPEPFYFALGCIFLIFLFAFRGRTGTDTPGYNRVFFEMSRRTLKQAYLLGQDKAFFVLTWFTNHISSGNLVFHNCVIGCIAYLPVLLVYKKESNDYVLAILLYIITGSYFFAFNGQREGLAISIAFSAFPFLFEHRYAKFYMLILIASLFHSSAILLIPFTLIITKKTNSAVFIISALVMFIFSVFIWQVWDQLFFFLGILGQDKIVQSYSGLSEVAAEGTGVNVLRVLVYLLPTLIGIANYRQLQEENDKFSIILNYNIISAILMIAALRTWLISRVSAYFYLAMPLLLVEISRIVTDNSKRLYFAAVVAMYLVYIWFSLHMESQLLPYNFTLFGIVKNFS